MGVEGGPLSERSPCWGQTPTPDLFEAVEKATHSVCFHTEVLVVFRVGAGPCLDTAFIFRVFVRLWKGQVRGCPAILPAGLLPQRSLSNSDPSAHTVPLLFGLSARLHSLPGDFSPAVSVQGQKGGLWNQRPAWSSLGLLRRSAFQLWLILTAAYPPWGSCPPCPGTAGCP